MSPFFAVFLVLLLISSSYAAGRLHGQLSYRIGYRIGYRQGYFDGDRGAWTRRRRDAQAAIASALGTPATTTGTGVPAASGVASSGTTYTAASFAGSPVNSGRHSTDVLAGGSA